MDIEEYDQEYDYDSDEREEFERKVHDDDFDDYCDDDN